MSELQDTGASGDQADTGTDDTKVDAGSLLAGGEPDAGAEQGGEPKQNGAQPSWPDDWRERLVAKLPQAERDKEAKRLARFASPENIWKSNRELEKRLSSGQVRPTLPDNPTDEEVAAYRKSVGIPETPDGYELAFPETIQAGETDKEDLARFAKEMHAVNASPAVVKKAFEVFTAVQAEAAQKRHEAAQELRVQAIAELRSEFGRDYGRNLRVAKGFAEQNGGGDELFDIQLANGTKLGDSPAFVKFLTTAALASAGDDTLVIADLASNSGGKSLDDRHAELMKLSAAPKGSEDWTKYWKGGGAEEAARLAAAREARAGR